MHSSTWSTDVFGYVYTGEMSDAKSVEQQQIEWLNVSDLPQNVISNLTWLIPLVLDKIRTQGFTVFTIEYT
jgi:hypothetical protein